MGKYFTNGHGYKGRILINKTIVCLYIVGYQKSKEFPIKRKTKSWYATVLLDTWCWTVEGELKTLHHTWGTVQKLAQNRHGTWGTFVAALHASLHKGHEWVSEGSRDGAVVSVLASRQRVPGLIPGPGVICGLSLLLVLFLALRGFSPGSPVFSGFLKNQHFQIPIWSGILSSTLSWASGSGDHASTPCVWH